METRVREVVADVGDTPRFSAGFVMLALCEGIERLRSVRPESRYFGLRLFDWRRPAGLADSTGITSDNDGLDESARAQARAFVPYVDERWNGALVHFAAARLYECDSTDTANAALAEGHMAKFGALAMM